MLTTTDAYYWVCSSDAPQGSSFMARIEVCTSLGADGLQYEGTVYTMGQESTWPLDEFLRHHQVLKKVTR